MQQQRHPSGGDQLVFWGTPLMTAARNRASSCTSSRRTATAAMRTSERWGRQHRLHPSGGEWQACWAMLRSAVATQSLAASGAAGGCCCGCFIGCWVLAARPAKCNAHPCRALLLPKQLLVAPDALPFLQTIVPYCRREGKRRVDEEYEYEDPRSAKRAAAGAAAGPQHARFGIRAPGATAALAAANLSSDSQVGLCRRVFWISVGL